MGLWSTFKSALLRERTSPWARQRPRAGTGAGRSARRQRGIALVMVLGSVAILTAVAIEFQYQSNVDLQLAVNARDELRADYLARSSVNMSRLLLRFQRQLDGQTASLGPALAALGMGGGGGGINLRLWEIIPIDCNLFNMLLGGGKSGAEAGATSDAPRFGEGLGELPVDGALSLKGEKAVLRSFGDFDGCFSASINDEEQKINLNRLNGGAATGRPPMLQALITFADPRFEFVFEKADANGVKMTAQETIIAIHDWIDERDTQASLNLTSAGDPYPDGFGDENRNYASRYPFRYRSKNAALDTLDELYQVDGVSDLFMAAFRDRITVYPDKNRVLNINTSDPVQQYLNIVTVADNESDPKLNPAGVTIQLINEQIATVKMFSFLGMSASTFVNIVKGAGIKIKPAIEANMQSNGWITDKSETFTVKATGQAGRVERTVTAVIRYNDQLGKVLYYRQE
ncbi:MAG TPA: type II secretion system minor pseudopilin GspK [Myxococcales bacterium]|jgi:general secretion pathway protein K